jgi:hypothetical protein
MANAPHPDGLIASRLEHLFRTVHPADRGPYTPGDVAAAINAEAEEDVISGQYIWLLRTGRRDNPTYKHLIAISRFFGVSPMYFFDESETDRGAIPAEVAVALQDDAVRDLALRAAGLSEHAQGDQRHGRQRPFPAEPAPFTSCPPGGQRLRAPPGHGAYLARSLA